MSEANIRVRFLRDTARVKSGSVVDLHPRSVELMNMGQEPLVELAPDAELNVIPGPDYWKPIRFACGYEMPGPRP